MIASGIVVTSIISGMLTNFSFTALVSFAEIIQFLCLFALLSVPEYPTPLNQLYNAQSPFSLNFIQIPNLILFDCSEINYNELLEGNYKNHPSILGINFTCNGYPILISIAGSIFLYVLAQILYFSFMKKLKKSYQWNGLIQIIHSIINVVMTIALVQFIYVL